ncbi:hypothetical protein GCM10009740_08230 [Terrabacter terrae]|uniref:Uncharacterized protein n=1 Tax=Terrabacter terrae TaxID=318434 RepID=A0ABN2TW13_9MICO
MAEYLVGVDFQPGDAPAPMTEWTPEEAPAHLAWYRLAPERGAAGRWSFAGVHVVRLTRGG